MKNKKALFVIGLIVLIAGGYFLIKKKSNKSPVADEFRSIDAVTGRYSKNPDTVSANSNWNNILPGKWFCYEKDIVDSNEVYVEGEIVFDNEKKFKLYVTRYIRDSRYVNARKKLAGGGSLAGTWQVTQDYIHLFNITDCNITVDSGYQSEDFRKCKYYEGKKYGNIEGVFKTDFEIFTNEKIEIKGKHYDNGNEYTCIFTRLQRLQ